MDLFKEIDDLNDLFLLEKNTKLDFAVEGYEDFQTKYKNLHENYMKELENSKKVEKCLIKCLKLYSKLCKKYEVQQKIITSLEESIKENVSRLEEAQKNEERMEGLIQVYRTERSLYSGQTNSQLKKDKEILLGICCKLIINPLKNRNIRDVTNLLLRKFKRDLDDDMINMLKGKSVKPKNEFDFSISEDRKSDFANLKSDVKFKIEDKYNDETTKFEKKELDDVSNNPLDLSMNKMESPESIHLCSLDSSQDRSIIPLVETEHYEPGILPRLPSLEKLPTSPKLPSANYEFNHAVGEKDFDQSRYLGIKASSSVITHLENITKSPPSSKYEETILTFTSHSDTSTQSDPQELLTETKCPGSIFDISDVCFNSRNSEIPVEQKSINEGSEHFLEKPDYLTFANDSNSMNPELVNSEEEAVFPYERELFKIFREMSSVRLLSPIRENTDSLMNIKTSSPTSTEPKINDGEKSLLGLKRSSEPDENCHKSKKLKPEEETPNCSLLDSIMSAMSIQNEEFKSKGVSTNSETSEGCHCSFDDLDRKIFTNKKKLRKNNSKENSLLVPQSSGKIENGRLPIDKLVTDEIKSFVSSPILSKEDADKNVRHCLSVLSNKSEDVIAKCTVAIVLENVDEIVEIFERPSPPLTKTQHRLIVLLTVLRTLDKGFENILTKILSIIWEKLFPDNFFWPDDSVEAATRFYAALCRIKNDSQTLWKFCLHAMTDMRQRCPLLMFTVLKTWPDILHNASTLKNNILALTIVNIFLHMPKKEGFRNFNQGRKLVALKHLLMNFYQFKVQESVEAYAEKVFDAVCREELGSKKSLVLLSKCKDKNWIIKNLIPMIKSRLTDWSEGKVEDSVANRILSAIKQIFPILQEDKLHLKIKETVSCLSKILTSEKKNHDSEVKIIKVLLQLKQYPEVRKVIREWIPKKPINDSLRSEIINASAEGILRELKLNRKKEAKNMIIKKKLKKHFKRSKVKKKRGKKSKKTTQKSKVGVACS